MAVDSEKVESANAEVMLFFLRLHYLFIFSSSTCESLLIFLSFNFISVHKLCPKLFTTNVSEEVGVSFGGL